MLQILSIQFNKTLLLFLNLSHINQKNNHYFVGRKIIELAKCFKNNHNYNKNLSPNHLVECTWVVYENEVV